MSESGPLDAYLGAHEKLVRLRLLQAKLPRQIEEARQEVAIAERALGLEPSREQEVDGPGSWRPGILDEGSSVPPVLAEARRAAIRVYEERVARGEHPVRPPDPHYVDESIEPRGRAAPAGMRSIREGKKTIRLQILEALGDKMMTAAEVAPLIFKPVDKTKNNMDSMVAAGQLQKLSQGGPRPALYGAVTALKAVPREPEDQEDVPDAPETATVRPAAPPVAL